MTAEGSIVWSEVADGARARVRAWDSVLDAGEAAPDLLGGMSRDAETFDFTRRLLEFVAGTDDAVTSALGLRDIAGEIPDSVSLRDRLAMRAGGAVSLGLPWAVMPVARKWLSSRVSHLVLAARLPSSPDQVGRLPGVSEALRRHSEAGLTAVLAPMGDAVHGARGVEAESARLAGLAAHPLVRHLEVDPARLAPGGSDWSAEDDIAAAAESLAPVLEAAKHHGVTVLMAPRSVRWARLMPELVTRVFADANHDSVRVGIRLLAELPESREHYSALSRWALRRVADGGAPAEVTFEVVGVAGRERIASMHTGLAVPVLEGRVATTAQLLRLAELALHPARAAALRPVIASEDPWVIAAATELASRLGSSDLFSVRLRSGVATEFAEMLAKQLTDVRIALPVVSPQSFTGALDVLLGYAAEAADPESVVAHWVGRDHFTDPLPNASEAAEPVHDVEEVGGTASGGATGGEGDAAGDAESSSPVSAEAVFRVAVAAVAEPAPVSQRTQLRAREWDPSERDSALFYRAPDEPALFDTGGLTAAVLGLTRGSLGELKLAEIAPPRVIPPVSSSGFANEPETDASLPANREWARAILRHAASEVAVIDDENPTIALSEADLDPLRSTERARSAGLAWASQPHNLRAVRLRRMALATVAARDKLLQNLARDTGAPVPVLDREANAVVDAARYSALLAEGLGAVRGATFVAEGLALVVAGPATPFVPQVEAVLSALAAGSGVLWSVSQRLVASARALLEEWEIGGLPAGTVRLEPVVAGATLSMIAAESGIDRAVVLGSRGMARDLARTRPDLRIEGVLPVPGLTLVGPSADFDAAVSDVIASSFGVSWADPRCTNGVVLLGSAARSKKFREGLADAVRALRVGDTSRPGEADPLGFDVGPLALPPSEAGLWALTTLGAGEEWLVRPEQLDEAGLLWRPGVRTGVAAGSRFWEDSVGLPVIGVAHAHTLNEALRLQNVGGAVAGLQSYDPDEVIAWLAGAQAAGLTINAATTASRTERQPSGGWNRAVVGLPALSGGPNRLLTLGSWQLREGTRSETLHLRGLDAEVQWLIEAVQPELGYEEFDELRRAALSDALTWRTSFGVTRDVLDLGVERNVLRYHPVATHVRLAEGGALAQLVRVLAAATLSRAPIAVSTGEVLPSELSALLTRLRVEVSLERDGDWVERLAATGPTAAAGEPAARVRLIGGDRVRAAEWLGGLDRVALWAEPVTMAGPVELLTLLREQSVSARAHRHGFAVAVAGLDELLER